MCCTPRTVTLSPESHPALQTFRHGRKQDSYKVIAGKTHLYLLPPRRSLIDLAWDVTHFHLPPLPHEQKMEISDGDIFYSRGFCKHWGKASPIPLGRAA